MTHVNAITKAIEVLQMVAQHGRIDDSESRMNAVCEALYNLRSLRNAVPDGLEDTVKFAGRLSSKDNPTNIDGNVVDIGKLWQAATAYLKASKGE